MRFVPSAVQRTQTELLWITLQKANLIFDSTLPDLLSPSISKFIIDGIDINQTIQQFVRLYWLCPNNFLSSSFLWACYLFCRAESKCSAMSSRCCSPDTCNFIPASEREVCSPSSDCTEEAYCTGQSAECPIPDKVPNGTPCYQNLKVTFCRTEHFITFWLIALIFLRSLWKLDQAADLYSCIYVLTCM